MKQPRERGSKVEPMGRQDEVDSVVWRLEVEPGNLDTRVELET